MRFSKLLFVFVVGCSHPPAPPASPAPAALSAPSTPPAPAHTPAYEELVGQLMPAFVVVKDQLLEQIGTSADCPKVAAILLAFDAAHPHAMRRQTELIEKLTDAEKDELQARYARDGKDLTLAQKGIDLKCPDDAAVEAALKLAGFR